MCQVLFTIPLKSWLGILWDVPIHGYGFMLFLAFIFCLFLATRLAHRLGINQETVQDVAIWLFIPGIIGARILFVFTELNYFLQDPLRIFAVWDGGLVFYGCALGGVVGFLGASIKVLKPRGISPWKMADVIAPCIVLGLCLGRIGCLLNGCCYGHVATVDSPALSFPMPTDPRKVLTHQGLQSAAGFTLAEGPMSQGVVDLVEPGSPAARAGLHPGDRILQVNRQNIHTDLDLDVAFNEGWPRGVNEVHLKVQRITYTARPQMRRGLLEQAAATVGLLPSPLGQGALLAAAAVLRDQPTSQPSYEDLDLNFAPGTLGLHPTQLYESISAALLVFLLLAYFPFRRHDGELIVVLMLCYAVHRFLNEAIRNDTDKFADGLTLSQNISLLLFLGGLALGWYIWRKPIQYGPKAVPTPPPSPAPAEKKKELPPAETALQD